MWFCAICKIAHTPMGDIMVNLNDALCITLGWITNFIGPSFLYQDGWFFQSNQLTKWFSHVTQFAVPMLLNSNDELFLICAHVPVKGDHDHKEALDVIHDNNHASAMQVGLQICS